MVFNLDIPTKNKLSSFQWNVVSTNLFRCNEVPAKSIKNFAETSLIKSSGNSINMMHTLLMNGAKDETV